MKSNRILWIIVTLAAFVWGGTTTYYFTVYRQAPAEIPKTIEVPGKLAVTPRVFKHTLSESSELPLSEQMFTLNYKGFLKEKKDKQWILTSGENELSFIISERTDFFRINGKKIKEPIGKNNIKTGDYLIALTLSVWVGDSDKKPPQYMNALQNQPVSEVWIVPAPTQ